MIGLLGLVIVSSKVCLAVCDPLNKRGCIMKMNFLICWLAISVTSIAFSMDDTFYSIRCRALGGSSLGKQEFFIMPP
jgi:hypothetical protein